jgi:hypothetical protein
MTTSAASPTSTPTGTGLPPQMAQKALAYLRRAIEKMKALQAVERVLGSIERVMLNRLPDKFDLSLLVAAINMLNLALREGDEDKVREAVFAVSQELDTATQSLIARDAAIMPYHLRRFCEEETTTLDLNALAAMTSFYRTLPHSETNRGKYDFVVTRLFSNAEPGRSARHRHLRITREQLAKRLTEMCAAWGEVILRDPADAQNISHSIAQFDQFIAEVKQINKFEEMVGREFFQRIRTCKAQIGSLLYLPEVTAASVESNVIVNSRFLTLLEIESEETQTDSPALNSLAGAFSDTYSDQPHEISAILLELEASTKHDEVAQKRVSRLTNLLQIARKHSPVFPLPEISVDEPDEAAKAPLASGFNASLAVEMDEELQAFAAVPENQSLIAAYCNASADARRLDLHSFLSPLPNGAHDELKGETKSRRAALDLIFQADKIIQTELGQECEPGEDIEARVEKLFDKLGQDSDDVRKWIKVAQKHEQNTNYEVLLHVYNQLMSARLRLQSAVVRRNTIEHAEDETPKTVPAQTAQPQVITTPDSAKEQVKTKGGRISLRQWLIIATTILLISAIGLNFALSKKQQAKDDAEVVRLDRSQMPHGALFTEAKTHQELMICVVTQKWLELSAQEQKEKMQELLTFGQERGVQRLILLDAKGKTVGFLSKEEAFVN